MRDERYTTVPFGAPTASLPFFNFYIGVKNNMSFSFINRVNNMIPAIHSSFLEIFTRETVLLRRCRCYRSAVASPHISLQYFQFRFFSRTHSFFYGTVCINR